MLQRTLHESAGEAAIAVRLAAGKGHASELEDFFYRNQRVMDAGHGAPRRVARRQELGLEMLVRAYDPCISCSTHYLDVRFVR